MKITDIELIPCNRFLFVEIHTDEGITGLGESGTWGFLDASREAMETFKDYLIGKDPLRIEHHWQYMYRSYHFRGAAIMGAISAIDIALWDIAGKYYGAPVWQLLGGKCRDKARVYYHVSGRTLDSMLNNLADAKAKGFTAVGHLNPFLDEPRSEPYYETHAQKITNAVKHVAAYREVLGDEVDICLELHRKLKPYEAITLAKELEPYHPYFYEDPTTPDNFDSMAYIAEHISIPIATGERYHTPQDFAMLARRNGAAFFRPDVCLCGGITGTKKIAALAEANDIMIVPHNPLSPVSTAACLQIAASIPNFAIQEYPGDGFLSRTDPWSRPNAYAEGARDANDNLTKRDIVHTDYKLENGFLTIPDSPGIGAELTKKAKKEFPYVRRPIETRLHIDGSVVDQ